LDFGGLSLDNSTPQYFWLVGHNQAGNIDTNTKYNGTFAHLCIRSDFVGALKLIIFIRMGVITLPGEAVIILAELPLIIISAGVWMLTAALMWPGIPLSGNHPTVINRKTDRDVD